MVKTGFQYYLRVLLKGSIAVSLAQASVKVIGLFLLPVFSHYLTPEEFGLATMVSVISGFFSLIYNPGMVSATKRVYHDTNSEEERQELVGSAFVFFLLFPVIITILAFIIGPFIFPTLFSEFPFFPYGALAVLLAFFAQPKRMWIVLMTLRYKIHITALYSVISVLIGATVALVLVVIFKLGALGKILAMFPPAIFMLIVSIIAVKKYSEGRWSVVSMKNQLLMGLPLIIAVWSYDVLYIADRYLLERMTDLSQVGIYSLGYTVAQVPLFLVMGIRQLWNPLFYENMNKRENSTVSKLILTYVIFLSVICLLVILFSKEAIILLINVKYHEAIPVVGLLIIGIYFSALITITNSILGYENKFGTTSKIALFAALSNIILNLLLIPNWGMMGAAMATVLSYLLYLVIGMVITKTYIKIFNIIPVFLYSSTYLTSSYALLTYFRADGITGLEIMSKTFLVIVFISGFVVIRIVNVSDLSKIIQLIRIR